MEVPKDYAKVFNHGEGPYEGLFLVESAYCDFCVGVPTPIYCLNSVFYVKVLVRAFNQEKAF